MNKFEHSLPMMLNKTLDVIMPKYRVVFKQHDITEQQWRILRVLWESGKCTTFELSDKTLLPAPSMVGIIDRMIKKGLVFRLRCTDDRRKTYVDATPEGAALQFEIAPKIDAIYADIMNTCKPEAWRQMLDTLQKIIDVEPREGTSNPKPTTVTSDTENN